MPERLVQAGFVCLARFYHHKVQRLDDGLTLTLSTVSRRIAAIQPALFVKRMSVSGGLVQRIAHLPPPP